MKYGVAALAASLMSVTAPALAQTRIVALSAEDAAVYERAFQAAENGDARGLEAALRLAEDDVLAAQAKARLLISPKYRPGYRDLTRWLSANAADPMGPLVRARAMALKPRRAAAPPPAARMPWRAEPDGGREVPSDPRRRAALEAIADDRFEAAESLARAAMADGRAPHKSAWTAGLLAFRRGDYATAQTDFAHSAASTDWDAWGAAGAHWWAARAALAAGTSEGVLAHLEAAARRPATFYGQLAEATLGRESPLNFTPPALDHRQVEAFFERRPGARRAAAYAQLGRLSDAERELAWVHGSLRGDDDALFLALAEALAAPAAQLRAAEFGGAESAAGFCPTGAFEPADGFRVDRAVILAITRQESRFNPVARSSANARGLMQLMPATAAWLTGEAHLRRRPDTLHDPALNMQLGQAYLEELKSQVTPNGDLAKVFAAYNGGPGWLGRWLAANPQDDPLLMLELMPRPETRDYAERVLSHLALCRKRLGQRPAEMEALASGLWPIYRAQDRESDAFAAAARPQS